MSDSPSQPAVYTVRLTDGRSFGPADAALLAQWAREGRVPPEAMIESDSAPPVRASDHPVTGVVHAAPPIVPGPVTESSGGNEAVATLIPYRNGFALGAYYTGVFSLIPFFGLILAPIALTLGVLGLRYAARHERAHGRVHAWVGIIIGSLVLLAYGTILVLLLSSKR